MIGLLYKDLRTNRKNLLMVFFVLAFFNAVASSAILMDDNSAGAANNTIFMIGFFGCFTLISYLLVGAFALNFVQTDERKKWGYYVTAVPGGIAKQVIAKYCFVGASVLVTFCICSATNIVVRSLNDKAPDLTGINVILAAVSLMMRSLELPFITAFGTKIGTQIKGGMMVLMILSVLTYGLFGDLSWIGSEYDFWDSFFKFINGFSTVSFGLKLLAAAVPMFAVSCCISVKLFPGGIDRLEK